MQQRLLHRHHDTLESGYEGKTACCGAKVMIKAAEAAHAAARSRRSSSRCDHPLRDNAIALGLSTPSMTFLSWL